MKSVELILSVLPGDILDRNEDGLTQTQKILRNLILHFNRPEYSFDLSQLSYLEKDYLVMALKAIHLFYAEDSYTLNGTKMIFIDKDNPLLNQAAFVSLLQDYGVNFDDRKLNVYYKRGSLPNADLQIQGKPYWYKSTALEFIQSKFAQLGYKTNNQ